MSFKVNNKVKIKKNAKNYATGQNIPEQYKDKVYTISQLRMRNNKQEALIKELYSWVFTTDLEFNTQKTPGLETGDTMNLFDKNKKKIGTWTFKKA